MRCRDVYVIEKISFMFFQSVFFHNKKYILDNLVYAPQIYFSVYNII